MAMPSFLTKLFRRRSPTAAENGGNGSTDQRKFKKQSGRKSNGEKNGMLIKKSNSSDSYKNGAKSLYGGFSVSGGKANSSMKVEETAKREPENGGGVLSPLNTHQGRNAQPVGQEQAAQKPSPYSSLGGGLPSGLETPTFDNDGDPAFSDENTNRANVQDPSKGENSSSTLSFQHLRQFEMEQRRQPYVMPEPHQLYSTPALEQKMQFNRLSNGQLVAQNPGSSSPVSSSDFCLSTDAEDVEYNAVRSGRGPPPLPNGNGKYALSHGNSSPMSFTTDDDNSHLFPALEDDNSRFGASVTSVEHKTADGATAPTTAASRFWNSLGGQNGDQLAAPEASSSARPISPRTAAIREAEKLKKIPSDLYPDSTDSENEGPGPSAAVSRKTQSARLAKKAQQLEPISAKSAFPSSSSPADASEFSSLGGRAPAQPDAAATSTKPIDFMDPAIEDFADFDNVKFPSVDDSGFFATEDEGKKSGDSRSLLLVETSASGEQKENDAMSSPFSSSFVPQTKQSRRSRRQNGQQSSSSVNSAPAVTASYLRQHHKLGSSSKSISEDPFSATSMNFSSSRLPKESGSDVLSGNSANADPESAAGAAKEKLRRRRKARESTDALTSPVALTSPKSTTSSKSRKNRPKSSRDEDDEGSDNGEAESWLFDEVTGALGPRGVAADLESLSGRSNRSKSSTGNKSLKSHRSHKSHKSKSRRHRSSNESSDSRSRTSRYSHKSVRSSMSHMSEQSRSVANDLLRLEMQLAMVGSQNNVEGGEGVAGSVGGGGDLSIGTTSLGGTSRASRTSRSTSRRSAAMAKRSKITVIAPPGKLGIILANKTDSKGTVVSGVRTSSVLAEKISPGDRIVAIDGEDVSRMTVSEITTIMARKSEFERILTVMTAPKHHTMSIAAGDHFSGMNGAGLADGESLGGSSVTSGTFSYNKR